MKITTTVPKLDKLLNGGIKDGSVVLILSDMLVDKALFGIDIFSGIVKERDGIYFVNNKFPDFIKENMHGWERIKSKVSFIDGFSYTAGKRSKEEFQVKIKTTQIEPYTNVLRTILSDAMKKRSRKTALFFDSLDYWIGYEKSMKEFVSTVRELTESTKSVSYYLLANLGFKAEEVRRLEKMFDYIIQLKAIERKGLVFKHIDVYKPPVKTKIPFELTLSGISIYVPKILVIGPYHAGKSTLIKALSQKPINIDRLGTTVALDHGWVERNGLAVDLFGTPGQERFDWITNFLSKSILGILLVVDSAKPDFKRAKEILEELQERDIPVVVLANKQDLPNAMKPKEIEKKLGFPTIGTVAVSKKGCDEALEKLFDEILKRQVFYK